MAARATLAAQLPLLMTGTPGHGQQPIPSTLTDIGRQTTLTGDWGGLRTELSQYGIAFNASYTAELFANTTGGIKRGVVYEGLFYAPILGKLIGWQDARFHISMLQGQGLSLSQGGSAISSPYQGP